MSVGWEQSSWTGLSSGDIPECQGGVEAPPSGPAEVALIWRWSGHLWEASMQEGCQGGRTGSGRLYGGRGVLGGGTGSQAEGLGWKPEEQLGIREGIWGLGMSLWELIALVY